MSDEPSGVPPQKGQTERLDDDAAQGALGRRVTDVQSLVPPPVSVNTPAVDADTLRRGPHAQQPGEETAVGDYAASFRDENDLEGFVLGDRYRLIYELGRGGMGQVYVGEHLTLRVPIAVKVMLPSLAADPQFIRRFEREARATSTLNHRNIVHVMDYGVHGNIPYLVMEFLEGMPLSEWLHRLDVLPPLEDVDDILKQLLDAFEAAHAAGITHRDLKPDNIFLSREPDGRRVVKVLDFGLAHMEEPEGSENLGTLTQGDMVSGTPEYMSPEQCRSLRVGPSSDLYAMGCLLTEMLQGEPPFQGENKVDILTKQMFVEPEPLNRPANAEPLPPLVERLRLELLAKRPARRPKDVAEIRAKWEEAMSPAENARQVPGRKGAAALGTRGDRIPDWTNPALRRDTDAPLDEVVSKVALVRFGDREDGVDQMCLVGLAARGVRILRAEPGGPPAPNAEAVLLDAEGGVEQAIKWIKANESHPAVAATIVCLPDVGGDGISQLIAVGVGDVVNYPVQVDVLRKKLSRLMRRKKKRAARPDS